jgi:epoxide hydrolase-like predicted phosphatase
MPIRAVIFDLGGVLVRTEDRQPRARLAERLGMSYDELSSVIFDSDSARQATLGQLSTDAHWEAVLQALRLTEQEFGLARQDFWGGDTLDMELVDYIRGLRPKYKTALLSNAWDNLRQVLDQHWRILDAFDQVIISAEVGLAKPDLRIYRLAVERLGVAPAEAVFVDDYADNLEGARAAGLQVVHFQERAQALAELAALLEDHTPGAGPETDR